MPNPGAIVVGAIFGLGIGVVGAIPFLAVGWDASTLSGQTALILVGLVAQFVAGYAAARIASADHGLHGGLAALTLYAAVAIISLAAAQEPSTATLLAGAVIALTMGTVAGVLARARTER